VQTLLAEARTSRSYALLGLEGSSSVRLRIGKIASLARVSADSLRYYGRERLIAPGAKSAGEITYRTNTHPGCCLRARAPYRHR
jgi:hypothetical protein